LFRSGWIGAVAEDHDIAVVERYQRIQLGECFFVSRMQPEHGT
jgi:hypothetical protein